MLTCMNIILEQPSANPVQLDQTAIHLLHWSPSGCIHAQSRAPRLQQIKTVIIGGAPLQASTVDALKTLPIKFMPPTA